MEKEERVKSWLESAGRNVVVAEDNFKMGHYDWCLFMWHLALEKLLKARLLRKEKEVVFTHNLIKLCQDSGMELDTGDLEDLAEINTFNLNARYDDYKFEFYRKATKEYCLTWRKKCSYFWGKIGGSNDSK